MRQTRQGLGALIAALSVGAAGAQDDRSNPGAGPTPAPGSPRPEILWQQETGG
jgi:hypothetical protein